MQHDLVTTTTQREGADSFGPLHYVIDVPAILRRNRVGQFLALVAGDYGDAAATIVEVMFLNGRMRTAALRDAVLQQKPTQPPAYGATCVLPSSLPPSLTWFFRVAFDVPFAALVEAHILQRCVGKDDPSTDQVGRCLLVVRLPPLPPHPHNAPTP